MIRKSTACLLLACLLCVGLIGTAQRRAKLRNQDVINMLHIRLPERAIIAAIEGSPADFDTSAAALNRVRRAGGSENILAAMRHAHSQPISIETSTVTTSENAAAAPPTASGTTGNTEFATLLAAAPVP